MKKRVGKSMCLSLLAGYTKIIHHLLPTDVLTVGCFPPRDPFPILSKAFAVLY